MTAAKEAGAKEQDVVLDLCAAPGGKSIYVAQQMHGKGRVIARDLTPQKVFLIEENIRRCQVSNMQAECADARILTHHGKNVRTSSLQTCHVRGLV